MKDRQIGRRERIQAKITALIKAATGAIDDMTPEQLAQLKLVLGDTFWELSTIDAPDMGLTNIELKGKLQ